MIAIQHMKLPIVMGASYLFHGDIDNKCFVTQSLCRHDTKSYITLHSS
jgi:hypothetical protein